MQPKNSTFSDRQAASVAAKKALLEKFKPKPTVQAETLAKKDTRGVSSKPGGPKEERVVDPFEEHRRYIQSLERGRERRRA